MKPKEKGVVRVRIAPSPTGPATLGTARTALYNFLFARQNGGAFILRIDDTDRERSKKEHEDTLVAALRWLELQWDEGPDKPARDAHGNPVAYRQSERTALYEPYLKKLLEEKKAYFCYCTKEELEAQRQSLEAQGMPPVYSGHCRRESSPLPGREPQVIRFATPPASVEFHDLIRGKITFDAALLGDVVIAKNTRTPLYNLANVVDDELMEVSHVIRGEDHISNTPLQILLGHALGFRELHYAHLPLMLAPDRTKLSKRTAEVSILEYRERGYLPEAMVNFLALLGWHPKGDKEVFTRNELLTEFDLSRVQKAGAIFTTEKLDWLNAQHIRRLPAEELARALAPRLAQEDLRPEPGMLSRMIEFSRTRLKLLGDFTEINGFYFKLPEYDPALLVWKGDTPEKTLAILAKLHEVLTSLSDVVFRKQTLMADLEELIAAHGKGSVLWPLRVALSGLATSPDPLEISEVLGKHTVLERVALAISKLSKTIKQEQES